MLSGRAALDQFASGENPKRVYGSRNELPSTRMGKLRRAGGMLFVQAQDYMRSWTTTTPSSAGRQDASPPKRDLNSKPSPHVLRGKLLAPDPLLSRRRVPH